MEQVIDDSDDIINMESLTAEYVAIIEEFKEDSDQEEEIKDQLSTASSTQVSSAGSSQRSSGIPTHISELKKGDVLEVKNYLGSWQLGIVVDEDDKLGRYIHF